MFTLGFRDCAQIILLLIHAQLLTFKYSSAYKKEDVSQNFSILEVVSVLVTMGCFAILINVIFILGTILPSVLGFEFVCGDTEQIVENDCANIYGGTCLAATLCCESSSQPSNICLRPGDKKIM